MGVEVSVVVKEVQNIAWHYPDPIGKKNELPICVVQLLVMVDEQMYAREEKIRSN